MSNGVRIDMKGENKRNFEADCVTYDPAFVNYKQ